jgi:capsular exopolysaccharide synthesis family protein
MWADGTAFGLPYDSSVRETSALEVIQRHRWLILAVFGTFVAVTALFSKSLTKIYQTEAALLVAVPAEAQSFDTVQASQSLARSYAEIARSRNMADRVAEELDDGTSAGDLLDVIQVEPVSETQLLEISAEDPEPERAQLIANTYATVFARYTRGPIANSTTAEVTLADPAPLPTSAARPKPTVYTVIAGLIGLALGLGLAFLREQLDTRIRSIEEIEERIEQPILGRVPPRGRSENSNQAFSEAYRILRTNLQFVRADKGLSSVAITSGRAGEGKTTTTAQLALAAAEMGLTVAVVEGDMRKPSLQRALLPETHEPLWPGLSNYLVDAADLDQVMHRAGKPNLYIVPAGPPPPSPSSLLEVPRGSTLVSGLLERVDFVILDTPPISVGADAAIMSTWVDGVIVVVDLAKSTHHGVTEALKQVGAVHATTLGLVLNRDRGAVGGGYGYYYGYQQPEEQNGKPPEPFEVIGSGHRTGT